MKKKKQKETNSSEKMNYKSQRSQYNYQTEYEPAYMSDFKGRTQDGYLLESMINGVMINPKQMYWICKRKARREFLDRLMVSQTNNYMHESRHRHAMKRMRAPSGRFLTKEEMNKLDKTNEDKQNE